MTKIQTFLMGFAFVAGCGGGASTPAAPETASMMVTAAAGGTVALGTASLAIPAGSLGADTMVTVTSETPPTGTPDAGTLQGKYYAFGPSGTTFNPAAMLSLPGATAPTGMKAVISTIEDGGTAWTDLPTTASGGMLTAPVAHFSGFSVRYVIVGGTAVDCAKAKAPCGGPITGAWTFSGICVADMPPQPLNSDCPTGTVIKTEKASGTATFNADLTYSVNFTVEVDATVTAPASCIQASGMTFANCVAVADAIAKKTSNATCTGTPSTGCTCTVPNADDPKTTNESGTYALGTDSFTTTKTGETSGSPTPYCVDGNTAWVQITDPVGTLVLTK